jgi:hypothetical protein
VLFPLDGESFWPSDFCRWYSHGSVNVWS